jgi:hypothetical protein
LLAGLFLAAALVTSAILFTRAWMRVSASEVITVTGYSKQEVTSDVIIWRGRFKVQEDTLEKALSKLHADSGTVSNFFTSRAITNFTISPPAVIEIKARDKDRGIDESKTVAYFISRDVQITSTNLDSVAALSSQASALLDQGVFFTTSQPDYIFTRAGELKKQLLAEATKDARARAEQIISQGGRKLGDLRAARMGVFQITPPYSTETSSEGINDTTSRAKVVRSVVSATFSLN